MDIEKLVKMANQIAANSDYGPDKNKIAATVADHLTRFWTPEMRAAIVDGHAKGLLDLTPTAARAVDVLAAARSSSVPRPDASSWPNADRRR